METPGRIVATPDALDFTVENVEKVSFETSQSVAATHQIIQHWGFLGMFQKRQPTWEGKKKSFICIVATIIMAFFLQNWFRLEKWCCCVCIQYEALIPSPHLFLHWTANGQKEWLDASTITDCSAPILCHRKMLVWVLFFSVGLDIFVCVCTAYTRACSLGSVGCFCQVAVMNLPAGWPLTGTQGDGWGDNGEDVERERERDWGKRCFFRRV